LIGNRTINATFDGECFSPDEVSSSDYDGALDPGAMNVGDFLGDVVKNVGVETKF
jgi:hypothetical protein